MANTSAVQIGMGVVAAGTVAVTITLAPMIG